MLQAADPLALLQQLLQLQGAANHVWAVGFHDHAFVGVLVVIILVPPRFLDYAGLSRWTNQVGNHDCNVSVIGKSRCNVIRPYQRSIRYFTDWIQARGANMDVPDLLLKSSIVYTLSRRPTGTRSVAMQKLGTTLNGPVDNDHARNWSAVTIAYSSKTLPAAPTFVLSPNTARKDFVWVYSGRWYNGIRRGYNGSPYH